MAAALIALVAAVALSMTAAAWWARRSRRASVVDVAWGLTFALAALAVGAVASHIGNADDAGRRWLLVTLVVLWGGRLGLHLGQRVRSSEHDDPRYEEMLGGTLAEVPFRTVVLKVFALQALLIVLISAPIVAGSTQPLKAGRAVAIGVLLWAIGLGFEAIGDAQLAAHRRNPNRPPVLTTGLWAWTRHPNYFGDACVWWGLWLVGGVASGWQVGLATVFAPALMTWFLTAVSGVRLAEKRMAGRPGWAAYAARTPAFFPRPPRR